MSFPYLAGAGLAAVSVAALTEWPLKTRVRLNSPSLWPTIFSVTYTGMNFLPLCTARVCPTISGITVERRDQVRTTFFSLRWFMPSILACRCESMNAPFLVERAISLSVLLLSAGHDERIGPLVVPSLVAARRLAPRSYRVAAAAGFALAAAMRMIDRVHDHATVGGANAQPAGTASLADGNVFVIEVANLPDSRHAIDQHLAGLARRHLEQRVIALFRNQLCLRSRRAGHLRAFPGLQLDVVHGCAGRDVAQRQGVAHQNVGLGTADDLGAHLQSHRVHDVPFLAIGVVQKRDARRAVGIVFDGGDDGRNPELVALEIDDAQLALVSAATMPDGQVARVAASAGALLRFRKRLVRTVRRQVIVDRGRREPPRRSNRSVSFNCHVSARFSCAAQLPLMRL